jgi:xylan 1,4-beta-xylosidase
LARIKNPIIPGMAPDPSILRVDNDFYIATSSFHWKKGIPIYHSKNLADWKLITYVLENRNINLQGTNTPAGIWAPHLSYDMETNKFWLAYSHMQNMAGREFNADSFAMSADSIYGPWSEPLYLTSIGFDPSLYHENGKHYLAILEWESRVGYQAPGTIVIAEINLESGELVGKWHEITRGFTTRGCIEAPQIYQHDGCYYLLAASGGTGYAHGVEMGRSKSIFGPYEANPANEPILTASPKHLFSLGDPDAGHFEMYNPTSKIQKAGHGSMVETKNGEVYIVHLMSRPLPNTKLNPLGRETAIQKFHWTKDGWLELADGSNLAKEEVEITDIQETNTKIGSFDIDDNFDNPEYDLHFMTPYSSQNDKWVMLDKKAQKLRIYGRNSFFSQIDPSIMATRATAFKYYVETKIDFCPDHYSQTAGVGLYYDSNNWLYARLCLADNETDIVLRVLQAYQGERKDHIYNEAAVKDKHVYLRIEYNFGKAIIKYRLSSTESWKTLGEEIDVSYLSDEGVNGEPGEIGGFTGLFNFIGATDAYQRKSFADFDYYRVQNED